MRIAKKAVEGEGEGWCGVRVWRKEEEKARTDRCAETEGKRQR